MQLFQWDSIHEIIINRTNRCYASQFGTNNTQLTQWSNPGEGDLSISWDKMSTIAQLTSVVKALCISLTSKAMTQTYTVTSKLQSKSIINWYIPYSDKTGMFHAAHSCYTVSYSSLFWQQLEKCMRLMIASGRNNVDNWFSMYAYCLGWLLEDIPPYAYKKLHQHLAFSQCVGRHGYISS